MQLLLLRHGKAVDREDWTGSDAERPLSPAGVRRTRRVLAALRPAVAVGGIWTSPWLRARQTADLARELWGLPLRTCPWLGTESDDPRPLLDQLDQRTDVVLVGHEPSLGALAGVLIGGSPVPLKKAGAVLLDGEPVAGGMALRWLITPGVALALAGDG